MQNAIYRILHRLITIGALMVFHHSLTLHHNDITAIRRKRKNELRTSISFPFSFRLTTQQLLNSLDTRTLLFPLDRGKQDIILKMIPYKTFCYSFICHSIKAFRI